MAKFTLENTYGVSVDQIERLDHLNKSYYQAFRLPSSLSEEKRHLILHELETIEGDIITNSTQGETGYVRGHISSSIRKLLDDVNTGSCLILAE